MEKTKKTNYLDNFKESIDWNSILTLMKVIAMTRDIYCLSGDNRDLSLAVELEDNAYSVEKTDTTVCITCSDGRKMTVEYDINGNHSDYQRSNYYAADASVTIEINDHSNIVLSSQFDWIDTRFKTIYLDNRDIASFNTVYATKVPTLGMIASYDYVSDDIIRSARNESFNITADTEEMLSSGHPLTSTVREAKEFRDNLTNDEAAHNYVASKVFDENELDNLVACLIKEANEKCAYEINQFWNEFYKKMEEIKKEREEAVSNISKNIEALLPSEREAVLAFLTEAVNKDQAKMIK